MSYPEMSDYYKKRLGTTYPTLPEDVRYLLSQVDGIGQTHGNTDRSGAIWFITNGTHIADAYLGALLAFQDYRMSSPDRDTLNDPKLDNLTKAIEIAGKNLDDWIGEAWIH
jgi:hypothetical protein